MSFNNTSYCLVILTLFSKEILSDYAVQKYSPRKWFTGSMTPYEVMGNLEDLNPIEYPDYEPKKIWFCGRHSTRFPEEKTLDAILHKLPRLQKSLVNSNSPCKSETLKSWNPLSNFENMGRKPFRKHDDPLTEKFNIEQVKKSLTVNGKITMTAMGERFRKRFGHFIPKEMDPRIEFKHTKKARTKQSATSFATGLFGKEPPENSPSFHESKPDDYTLKFDSNCYWWKLVIKRSDKNAKMTKAFNRGEKMKEVLNTVRGRCRLPKLSQKTLMHIYMSCSYELTWFDHSPWCDFFKDEAELDVLEYVEDLKLFNTCAYGDEWNYKIACPLFNDMFEFLTSKSEALARFSFSHAKTLIKFSALLGLYNKSNEKLTDENYKNKNEREWASSFFAGFGFNLTFVLYESKDHQNQAVLLMLNERVVKIPGCPEDTDLCPLERFAKIFEDSIKNCDFEGWCKNEEYKPKYEEYLRKKAELKDGSSSSPIKLESREEFMLHSSLEPMNLNNSLA